MILLERGLITAADVERALEILETVDLEAVNLIRAYLRRLEGLALAGEMLQEEEGMIYET